MILDVISGIILVMLTALYVLSKAARLRVQEVVGIGVLVLIIFGTLISSL